MFRYLLHLVDGEDLGEAEYPGPLHVDDVVNYGATRYRVVRLVEFAEQLESPFAGMVQVEPEH